MPYLPAQVVATAYQIVFQTGMFNDDCKVWMCKADAYKNWANFKIDFSTAHQEWRQPQATYSGSDVFQIANIDHQKYTIDDFASLSTSTTSDRSAVAALTVTNNKLAADCTATHALLVTALWYLTKLQASVSDLKCQLSTTSPVRYHINHY